MSRDCACGRNLAVHSGLDCGPYLKGSRVHIKDVRPIKAPAPAVPPEYERVVEALRGLASWTDDVLRGWQAHKKLAEGFSGMGHNILVEDAGKYGSMSVWLRVERALAEARTVLAAVDAARKERG